MVLRKSFVEKKREEAMKKLGCPDQITWFEKSNLQFIFSKISPPGFLHSLIQKEMSARSSFVNQQTLRLQVCAGQTAAVWAAVTELAKGPHIKADLGQGFPDFEGDDAALVAARMHLGPAGGDAARARLQQYSAVSGPPSLREALAEWYAKRYADGRRIDGDKELIVCTSGTEALYVALASLLEPGDK